MDFSQLAKKSARLGPYGIRNPGSQAGVLDLKRGKRASNNINQVMVDIRKRWEDEARRKEVRDKETARIRICRPDLEAVDQIDRAFKETGQSDQATYDEDSLEDEMACIHCLKEKIETKRKRLVEAQKQVKPPSVMQQQLAEMFKKEVVVRMKIEAMRQQEYELQAAEIQAKVNL